MTSDTANNFDPRQISRPEQSLLTYYLLVSLLTVFGFPFVFIPFLLRYCTLKYTFTDDGVSASWGVLFHREVHLTYRRIQDIHVTRNLFHRWLGLAAVQIQTASGSAQAELTVEGIRNPESLRDFLYLKMRGVREEHAASDSAALGTSPTTQNDEALRLLREIRDELRSMRAAREQQP